MNIVKKSWQLIALSLMMSIAVSCDKDDTPSTPDTNKKSFLVETTIKNADGKSGSSYVQLLSDFSGKVDNYNAIQLGINAFISVQNKTEVFEFPDFIGQSLAVKKHSYTGDKLELQGELTLPVGAGAYLLMKISEEKAYVPLLFLGKIWVVNPKTMTKISEIDLTSYAHTDNNPEPTLAYVRNGKCYVALGQMNPSTYMPYDDYSQVDVLVINTQTDKVEKKISETTTGLIYPRPYKNTMFSTEQQDIYLVCAGFYGLNPMNKKSGFVCIPNGQDEFDPSKSWDISNTTIEGTSYKPVTMYNTYYMGNGKVLAYVGIAELLGANPFTAKYLMAVEMNLNTKTIKKIEGIPTTDGQSVFIGTYKNDYVFANYGESKAGFYTYNPQTQKAQLTLETVGNPVFFHYFE